MPSLPPRVSAFGGADVITPPASIAVAAVRARTLLRMRLLRLVDVSEQRYCDHLVPPRPFESRCKLSRARTLNKRSGTCRSREEKDMSHSSYRTALIVGAGSGLSASLARAFAKAQITVALAARSVADLASLAAETGAELFACDAVNTEEHTSELQSH